MFVRCTQGLTYNFRLRAYVGFADSSPLDLGKRLNNANANYTDMVSDLATHISVWYYHNTTGNLSMPVATFATTEKSKVRQFDMALRSFDVIARLKLYGFDVLYTITDGHSCNVVRGPVC